MALNYKNGLIYHDIEIEILQSDADKNTSSNGSLLESKLSKVAEARKKNKNY